MPRSFSGRTKVFEAFYVGSIPALGAKVGAGVVYGAPADLYTASLQIRARTGFNSQRQHHAFEAHEDEQAVLTRQAVGSIPTGRTKFGTVAKW